MIKASGNPPQRTKHWTKWLDFYQYLSKNVDNIYCFASKVQPHHSSFNKKMNNSSMNCRYCHNSNGKMQKCFLSMIFPILLSIWKVPKINYFDSTHEDTKCYSVEIIRIAFEPQLNLRFIISLAEYFKSREYIFDVSERLFSWINFWLIFLNIKNNKNLKQVNSDNFFSNITWYSHKIMFLYSMLFLTSSVARINWTDYIFVDRHKNEKI